MRIALLAPLPPEQTGIADYAEHFRRALVERGVEVLTPLQGCTPERLGERLSSFDWSQVQLAHAELGGGRLNEFHSLDYLRRYQPGLALTATVHDPERLVWRRAQLPWPLSLAERLPRPLPQAAALLADPLTLYEERRLARHLRRAVTLTELGGRCLTKRMGLRAEQSATIAHGNLPLAAAELPPLEPLRLLYFGFIYRGKGIEDLLNALAQVFARLPSLRGRLRLALAGGTAPEMAFGPAGNYLDELRALAKRLELSDSLDWHLDLPSDAIASTIQAHHVMVLPYRESKKLGLLGEMRGTSGALSWANACGRGVITSNARAFAEEVASGNGATYPQGDVAALAQAIEALALRPAEAVRWAARAGEIGRERNWAATAERFHSLFSAACGEA
ncbi:glycosyltransferase [Pseudomonas sp. BMS12]|uniref:glycosyltransferase n=1 Tax=Pseudomonas sp. BMS12 TaxID=1796033 RepID=UPI00083B5F5E|nr:glycosyltransferase [Pseudomonas sp. BMS12]